jgi:hypothetical protein
MTDALNRSLFLVKERTGFLRSGHGYDIHEPESGETLLECREQSISKLTRFFRLFALTRRTTPFDLVVRTTEGGTVLRMRRGVPIVFSRVAVYDDQDVLLGTFQQRPWALRRAFEVLDANDEPVCRIEGKLGALNVRFVTSDGAELARVTKKWAGLGKELFTSADDHVLEVDEVVPPNSTIRRLILASVICADVVLKIEIP